MPPRNRQGPRRPKPQPEPEPPPSTHEVAVTRIEAAETVGWRNPHYAVACSCGWEGLDWLTLRYADEEADRHRRRVAQEIASG